MTRDELNQLIGRHGGLASMPVALNPSIDNPAKEKPSDPDKVPNPNPTYRYVFKDGTEFAGVSETDDTGAVTGVQVTDPGSALKPNSGGDNDPSLVAQRQASAAESTERTTQLAAERAQREANQQKGLGYVTDAEAAKLASDAASQGLTRDQINLRRTELEQSGRQRDRELDIAAANNAIAAANAALAARRTELDEAYRKGQMSLDQAKFEYAKAKDAADQSISQGRLDLERLAQGQTNAIAQQTLAQRTAEGAETARNNAAVLAQRQAEQRQAAETAAQTAAANAAGTILTNERTAQQEGARTGAGVLQNRVTNAQQMLQGILGLAASGQRSGNMGGGLMSVPAGLGEQLVGGIQGWTTQLGGGQAVYDTAARLVTAADPNNGQSPEAHVAMGVLTQMLEKYQDATRQLHPEVAKTIAAQQQQQQQQPQPFISPPPIVSSGSQGAGNPWAGGNTPPPGTVWQNPAFVAPAPVTVPV